MKIELPPIVEFQIKIIRNFENTDCAGRESTLVLPPLDLTFPLVFFREWLKNKTGFSIYMEKLFYRSLKIIEQEEIIVEKDSINNWVNSLGIKNKKYHCINEHMNPETEKWEYQISFNKKPKTRH